MCVHGGQMKDELDGGGEHLYPIKRITPPSLLLMSLYMYTY